MPVSEKQKQYARDHIKKQLDEIKIRPKKGSKDRWKSAADAEGKSLQQFIIDAVEAAVAAQEAKAAPVSPETQRCLDLRRAAVLSSQYIPDGTAVKPEDFCKHHPREGEK